MGGLLVQHNAHASEDHRPRSCRRSLWSRTQLSMMLLMVLASCATASAATRNSNPITEVGSAAPLLPSEIAASDAAAVLQNTANRSLSADDHDKELSLLLRWAEKERRRESVESSPPPGRRCTDCFLVIGVKIQVLRGFRERQAIRETWAAAHAMQQHSTRVVFLGCEPEYAALNMTDDHVEALREAVALEKSVFRDLLTDELSLCVDSYYRLVDKTLSFFQWVTHSHAHAAYVMVTDDDAYVRVDKLTAMLRANSTPTSRYYAGQVWATQYLRSIEPRRDPAEKNYLAFAQYAMRELPPFAIGPHYVVSADLVQFVAKNRDDLRGVGTLEDVSVAFWLLSLLQVRALHVNAFSSLRFMPCHNALISYAHLSPRAMRLIHANLVQAKSFCRGFSFSGWDKEPPKQRLPTSAVTGPFRVERALVYEWDLQWEPTARRAQIVVRIVAGDEAAEALYQPVLVPYVGFCRFLLNHTATLMPTTVIPSQFCDDHRAQLTRVVDKAVAATPSLAQFFYAPLTNLQQGSASAAAVFVRLTPRAAQSVRTLVECLVAAMYPDAHAYVVDEAEHARAFGVMEPDFSVSLAAERVPSPTFSTIPIVFATDGTLPPLETTKLEKKPAIWLSPVAHSALSARHIYLPQASLTFSRRANHSPVDLLSARDDDLVSTRQFVLHECTSLRVVAAAAAQVLIESLRHEDPALTIQESCEPVEATPNATQPLFPLDESVTHYAQFKFVVVFDNRTRDSRQVSDRLVTAFLAGAIPIVNGDVTSICRVFNPRAFIACSDFASLRTCARHVVHLHRHTTEYDAMRRQSPVVNTTALVEIFSWHPDVAIRLAKPLGLATMADRLKAMVDDWPVE